MERITKQEWIWVTIFSMVIIVLLISPFILGFLSQTPEMKFGGGILGVEDFNSYIAKMNQGAHGNWLFRLPYSSEKQIGMPIYGFYILLGKLAGPGHTSQIIIFHLARMFFSMVFIYVAYLFIAEYISTIELRRLALILVILGGGLGWCLLFLGTTSLGTTPPIEFYSPEAFSFLMLLTFPHLILARILMLGALLSFLHNKNILSGVLLIPLSFIQPLMVIIAWLVITIAVLLGYFAKNKRIDIGKVIKTTRPLLPIYLLSFPIIAYLGYRFLTDPILKQWNLQNNLPSPNPIIYLFTYSIYLIPAVFGMINLGKAKPELARFTFGWAALIPFLLYAPISIQRRSIEAFQIPFASLTVIGLSTFAKAHSRRLVPLMLLFTLPATFILWVGCIQLTLNPREPIFHPSRLIETLNWLDKNLPQGSVVLSSFKTGNALPAYTSLVSYIGHAIETVNVVEKSKRVTQFFQSTTSNNERLQLLNDAGISYLIQGPSEKDLGNFNPEKSDYLTLEFSNGTYKVFRYIKK